MKNLEKYFATWDPMDFIKELEAPADEYSLEVKTVFERYKEEMTPEQVGVLTYNVFVEMIESDYEGFKEDAIRRGEDIKRIIDKEVI